MIRKAFAALGRFILLLASLAFVAALSLFVFGTFLLTWPILRLSPRDRKLRATVNLASSAMTLFTVLGEAQATKALADALAMAADEDVLNDYDDVEKPTEPTGESLKVDSFRDEWRDPRARIDEDRDPDA